MIIHRCPNCKVSWEDGRPAKHLMTCTAKDTVTSHGYHRKPTEMEARVMTAIAGWNIGDDRFEVARAVIRAMRNPTTEMLRESGMVVAGNTEAHAAVWDTMIDAASPQEE